MSNQTGNAGDVRDGGIQLKNLIKNLNFKFVHAFFFLYLTFILRLPTFIHAADIT